MQFDCKEIDISEDEYGCSITFSDKEIGIAKDDMTIEELLHYSGQYLMLLRKYRENELEDDYLYLETIDPNKSGEMQNFLMNISHSRFSLSYEKDVIEIDLNINEQKFEEIKYIIKKITKKKGQLRIDD